MTDHDGNARTEGWLYRRRTQFAIAAAIWMSFVLIHIVQSFVGAQAADRPWTFVGAFTNSFPWWFSWLLLTPLIAWFVERFPFSEGQHWQAIGRHAALAIPLSQASVPFRRGLPRSQEKLRSNRGILRLQRLGLVLVDRSGVGAEMPQLPHVLGQRFRRHRRCRAHGR